jgi:hypothetical protein
VEGVLTVTQFEIRTIWRQRSIWFAAVIMIVLGVWIASDVRENLFGAFSSFTFCATLTALFLTLISGDSLIRDRALRLHDIVMSTPISTISFVAGKVMAQIISMFLLLLLQLFAAIFTDHYGHPQFIFGHPNFPSLGWDVYVKIWLQLDLVPVIFGVCLATACITLFRGQRVVPTIFILLFYLLPMFAYNQFPSVIDLSAMSFYYHLASTDQLIEIAKTYTTVSPEAASALLVHARSLIPPPDLPLTFTINRLIYLILSILLFGGIVNIVSRQRIAPPQKG